LGEKSRRLPQDLVRRLSSRFSRSSSFRRSRSAVVNPGRRPVSRSACRTQLRSVSAVQPILVAIDRIADHSESYSSRCSNTIRTARSRTSGENLFGLPIAPSSQIMEPPGIPGRFTIGHEESPFRSPPLRAVRLNRFV
jgi:hypothetical protein